VLLRVDVTDAAKPRMLGELPLSGTAGAHLDTVVGDAVMLTDAGPAPVRVPRSVQLMSFADPSHPKLVREFVNVTGFLKDDARGLVYLFNDTGLWILQQRSGPDLELLEQYQREVFYNR
jgi:hypothetical protein